MTNQNDDFEKYREWVEAFEGTDDPRGCWVGLDDIPALLEGESDEFKASYLRAIRKEGLRHQQRKRLSLERASKPAEPTDFSVADLRAYLDLPDEIADIAPFPRPVIDDEVINLLGRFFKEEHREVKRQAQTVAMEGLDAAFVEMSL